jgi:geranylgeranyl reductase family protein
MTNDEALVNTSSSFVIRHSSFSHDVAIVGAGPGGSACAALCAAAGLRTLLLDRAVSPRDKVCGDCLNPACWPIFDRLGVSERVLALPHARLDHVEFVGRGGHTVRIPLPPDERGEVAVSRALLDDVLLRRAGELGAEVHQGAAVTGIAPEWKIETMEGVFTARHLVAADGRNSTVARLLGLQPPPRRDRVALQAHVPDRGDFARKVALHFLPDGYAGAADIGAGMLNLCLVARAAHIDTLKAWAARRFTLSEQQCWRSMAPLARRAIAPRHGTLLLVGDAARVVEPFTGEGISYALASGALAADCLIRGRLDDYATAHAALYRGRLWINRLAKAAVLSPRISSALFAVARHRPGLIRFLTSKVIHPSSDTR